VIFLKNVGVLKTGDRGEREMRTKRRNIKESKKEKGKGLVKHK